MLTNKPDQPHRNVPPRDSAYWSALLDQVEAMPSEELELISERLDVGFSEIGAPKGSRTEIAAWQKAQSAYENEDVFEVNAIGCNKGGLLIEWNGLSGFIPASQLNNFPLVHIESERIQELQLRQGKPLVVRIIEVNPLKNRLIFSERSALVEADARRTLWDEIALGDKRTGVITNMANFGAFVDLGGVEGLIHISELSWSRLTHPSDVVRPGQRVTCIVLEIDRAEGRVALSLKRMKPDPWAGIERRYQPGQIVQGIVTNVVQYGAFVTLEDELEGLIHTSELAEGNFLHPRNVVQKGQWITAKVLTVSSKQRRIALTLRGITTERRQ